MKKLNLLLFLIQFLKTNFIKTCIVLLGLFLTATSCNSTPQISEESETISVLFSHQSGFYDSDFFLKLHSDIGDTILYTLDGSFPDINNVGGVQYKIKPCIDCEFEYRTIETFIYNEPIKVYDRSSEENNVSTIPNSYIKFAPPPNRLDKATIIRAAILSEKKSNSIYTKVYFIGDTLKNYLSLPVLSLVIQEDDFWGYKRGIYVPGKNFNPENLDYSGNHFQRGSDWERPVYAEYFDTNADIGFSQQLGLRIHGGTSRKFSNRSLRLYARSKYGKNVIEYPLFKNRDRHVHKRLKLRTSGQDIIHTLFRDALMCNLMINTNVITEDYHQVNLFINGEYWGIFNIRERFDNHYVERNFDIPRDEVEILDNWRVTNSNYELFRDFVTKIDSDKKLYYKIVSHFIDLNSFIDKKIAEIFFGRWDIHWEIWRQSNNKCSKWQWVLWDMDVGMGLPNVWGPEWSHNAEVDANYLKPFLTDYRTETLNLEFYHIMQNPIIRNIFINRFAEMMSSNLSEERIMQKIKVISENIKPSIPKHIDRWLSVEGIPSMEHWYHSIELMKDFAKNRHQHVYNHLLEHFKIEGISEVKVKNTTKNGTIKINGNELSNLIDETINPKNKYWECLYFKNIPVELSIVPNSKNKFIGWEVNGQIFSEKEKITLLFSDDQYLIIPVFKLSNMML